MNQPRPCFRCQRVFTPVENAGRGFCCRCTQEDLTISWLAFGKTYLPKPVFGGKDAEDADDRVGNDAERPAGPH